MAQATNIVLADAQATPVNHTFVPIGQDEKGVMHYVDQSNANEIGYWRATCEIIKPRVARAGESSKDRVSRVRWTLSEPILETLSNNSAGYVPAPTIAYIPRVTTEYVLHERCTLQNRKDLRKMNASLQTHPDVVNTVENGQYLSF